MQTDSMSFAALISNLVFGLAIGGAARFAVPGPDPMPMWLTATLGLLGSMLGGGVSVALYGLFAPVKTPPEVLQLLQREVSVSLNDATLKEKLLGQGIEIESSTPEALRDLLQAEIAKWARVIKDAGITPE